MLMDLMCDLMDLIPITKPQKSSLLFSLIVQTKIFAPQKTNTMTSPLVRLE